MKFSCIFGYNVEAHGRARTKTRTRFSKIARRRLKEEKGKTGDERAMEQETERKV